MFGPPGRRAIEARLTGLKDELGTGFCIVNGENAADGTGLTAQLAEKLLASETTSGDSVTSCPSSPRTPG